jgi:hypothetical protein
MKGVSMSVGVTVELTVEDIAHTIKKLKKEDKEMLLLILSGKDKEISKRYREIKSGKVRALSREEIFGNVL